MYSYLLLVRGKKTTKTFIFIRLVLTFSQNTSGTMRMKMEAIHWPSVFSGAQSYNPAAIPIFFRMGRVKHNRPNFGLRLKAVGNLDLMKVQYCLVM